MRIVAGSYESIAADTADQGFFKAFLVVEGVAIKFRYTSTSWLYFFLPQRSILH